MLSRITDELDLIFLLMITLGGLAFIGVLIWGIVYLLTVLLPSYIATCT